MHWNKIYRFKGTRLLCKEPIITLQEKMAGKTDYSKGKIYCIRSHQCEKVYVGSSCSMLSRRMYDHRRDFKRWIQGKPQDFITSYEILKHGDAYIELIEKWPCSDRDELRAREGKWQRELNCVNKRVEGRTHAQWREDNKEACKAYSVKYRLNNKDKIRDRDKRYRENNRDTMKAYQTIYKKANKENLKAQQAERFQCCCGSELNRGKIARHKRSKKHRQYMFNLHNELNHLES